MVGNFFKELIEKSGDQWDRDLKGPTNPFRQEVAPEGVSYASMAYNSETSPFIRSDKISKSKNYYEINSYQWYTSDIARRFTDDYYNSIKIPFAKKGSASSKGFVDTIIDNAKEKINDAVDTVVDSVNQIVDSVDNLLNGDKAKDPGPSQEEIQNNFNSYLKTFPYAKVYEFRPRDTLGANLAVLSKAFKCIDKFVDGEGNFTEILEDIFVGVKSFLKEEFQLDLDDARSFTDPYTRIVGLPNKMYKNLISGYYTAYYEIPILEYDGYLNGQGSTGWKAQGFMERMVTDNIASTVKGFMSDKIGSSIDIATRPKWQIEGGGDPFPSIKLELVLFNDTFKALLNNLAFIHSYVSGTLWYQDGFIQKCSALYDVEIPGRFRYYFCTCDISVEYLGKVRQVVDMDKEGKDNIFLRWFNKDAGKDNYSPNLDVLNNVPDAYKLTFTYNSLLPNNYNTYISYVTQTKDDAVSVGMTLTSLSEKFITAIDTATTAADIKRKQELTDKINAYELEEMNYELDEMMIAEDDARNAMLDTNQGSNPINSGVA